MIIYRILAANFWPLRHFFKRSQSFLWNTKTEKKMELKSVIWSKTKKKNRWKVFKICFKRTHFWFFSFNISWYINTSRSFLEEYQIIFIEKHLIPGKPRRQMCYPKTIISSSTSLQGRWRVGAAISEKTSCTSEDRFALKTWMENLISTKFLKKALFGMPWKTMTGVWSWRCKRSQQYQKFYYRYFQDALDIDISKTKKLTIDSSIRSN